MRRVVVLLGHDPATGCATAVAGVMGAEGGTSFVSWVAHQEAADGWRERVAATTVPAAEALEAWAELADGVSWDLEEIAPPDSPDLRGSVEAALDELLAVGGEG